MNSLPITQNDPDELFARIISLMVAEQALYIPQKNSLSKVMEPHNRYGSTGK